MPDGQEHRVFSLEHNQLGHPPGGRLDELDKLLRHLGPIGLVDDHRRIERARLVTETLALLGLLALVVDVKGRVLAANEFVRENVEFLRWITTDRIAFRDRAAQAFMRDALKRISFNAAVGRRAFPARSAEAASLVLVHVIPIVGNRDIFSGDVLIALSPIAPTPAPSLGLIQALFDLSPREARVAQGLARGATLDQIATEAKVSRNTIRSQLRVVFEKTGCKRQAEVALLLSRLSSSAFF
jgi:DNA-binding CsgD family transcriptional regulator